MSRVGSFFFGTLTVLLATAIIGGIGFAVVAGARALVFSDASERIFTQGTPAEPMPEWAPPAQAPPRTDLVPAGASETTYLEQVDAGWLAQVAEETSIPHRALQAYAAADLHLRDTQGCTVGWNTLAGIGWVESRHGTLQDGEIEADGVARPEIIGVALDGTGNTMHISDTDGGVLDGDTEYDRAVGPMQFIPETWRIHGISAHGDGYANPHSVDDAALTAASYLCRLDGSLENQQNWTRAVLSYNDSEQYQGQVAQAAENYANLADQD